MLWKRKPKNMLSEADQSIVDDVVALISREGMTLDNTTPLSLAWSVCSWTFENIQVDVDDFYSEYTCSVRIDRKSVVLSKHAQDQIFGRIKYLFQSWQKAYEAEQSRVALEEKNQALGVIRSKL